MWCSFSRQKYIQASWDIYWTSETLFSKVKTDVELLFFKYGNELARPEKASKKKKKTWKNKLSLGPRIIN